MGPLGPPKAVYDHRIADAVRRCCLLFDSVLLQAEAVAGTTETKFQPRQWGDESGRFRMWAANIGAHLKNVASLDFRLRDAPHISSQVLRLLESLFESLKFAGLILLGGQDFMNGEEELFEDNECEMDVNELQETLNSVILRIDNLLEMSLLIRRPIKLRRAAKMKRPALSAYKSYDLSHVREKFSAASSDVLERLAASTTWRRAVLKGYDAHRDKYARNIEKVAQSAEALPDTATVSQATTFRSTSLTADDDSKSLSGKSMASMKSLLDSERPVHIPIPEQLRARKPYPCPYCHYLLDIYEPLQYVRHVLEDITPYQCLSLECPNGQELLASKSAWLLHMGEAHREYWSQAINQPCFLCGIETIDQIEHSPEKHIARHLEELAIHVLSSFDDEQGSDIEDSHREIVSYQDFCGDVTYFTQLEARTLSLDDAGDPDDNDNDNSVQGASSFEYDDSVQASHQ